MSIDIPSGTLITYHGHEVGSVERVEPGTQSGRPEAVVLRSGRSPSLLRIAADLLQPDEGTMWRIDPSVELDALEEEAMESGVLPPSGTHLADAGLTEPSPAPEQTLGSVAGMPPEYDGAATG